MKDIDWIKRYGLEEDTLPEHVGIIMDGNGRWARNRHMPRTFGHKKGAEVVRDIVLSSSKFGVKALTIFAFSTENWRRPKDEVDTIMTLLSQYLRNEIAALNENDVVFRVIGDRSGLSKMLLQLIEESEELTRNNTGLRFNVAINYGSQAEILNAAFALAKDYKEGKTALDREAFENRLYTSGLPMVDFLIRTSGELRISNFLLYQIAYAELYFTDAYWPDFNTERYVEALKDYSHRNRRFGGV